MKVRKNYCLHFRVFMKLYIPTVCRQININDTAPCNLLPPCLTHSVWRPAEKVKENILLKKPTLPHPSLATFKKKSQSTISLSPTITRNFPYPLKEKRHKSPSNCYVNSGGGELTLIDIGLTSGTKTMFEATIHM